MHQLQPAAPPPVGDMYLITLGSALLTRVYFHDKPCF